MDDDTYNYDYDDTYNYDEWMIYEPNTSPNIIVDYCDNTFDIGASKTRLNTGYFGTSKQKDKKKPEHRSLNDEWDF